MNNDFERLKEELKDEVSGDYDFVTNTGPYWEDLQPRPKPVKTEPVKPKKTWLQLLITKIRGYIR